MGRIIAGIKVSPSPIVKTARGRRRYVIHSAGEERERKPDGRSLLFCTGTALQEGKLSKRISRRIVWKKRSGT